MRMSQKDYIWEIFQRSIKSGDLGPKEIFTEKEGYVMKGKKIKKSVFFRLFLTILLVMIPINIILLIYAVFLFHNIRTQVYQEKEAVMEMYIDQMDSEIDQMMTRLYRQASDYDMLLLMQSDEAHSQSDIEWNGARNRLMNQYRDWIQDYTVVDGIYAYFDYGTEGKNSYAIRSASPNRVLEINRKIIQSLEDDIAQACRQGDIFMGSPWHIEEFDGEYVIVRAWKRNNCYYGFWINLNRVLDLWGNQAQDKAAFEFTEENETLPERRISVPSQYLPLSLSEPSKTSPIMNSMPAVVIVLIVLAILALAAIPLLAFVTRKYILKPVNQLLGAMEMVKAGDLSYQIPEGQISGEFAILNSSFNSMIRDLHDTKIAAYESEVQRQRIQMRYLSQQIQPHFVLNTLNILYSYEDYEYPLIQKMILCLSRYFRYIVKVHSDFVELGQELDHIKNYFEIQAARYPEQFDYYVEAQEGMEELMIPPLLIQNFTENSIKYSISMESKISIYVLVEFYEKDKMRIRIADTGKGLSDKVLSAIRRFRETHKYQEDLGIGIQNAIERLEILYNGIPKIQFYNSVSGGATIDIIMPCLTREKTEEMRHAGSHDC